MNISCEDFYLNLCSWHHLLKQNINFKISKSFPHKCFVHVLLFASDEKFLGNLFVFMLTRISMRTMEKYTLVLSENYSKFLAASDYLISKVDYLENYVCKFVYFLRFYSPFIYHNIKCIVFNGLWNVNTTIIDMFVALVEFNIWPGGCRSTTKCRECDVCALTTCL